MEIRDDCRPAVRRSSRAGLFLQQPGNTDQKVCGTGKEGTGRPCACPKRDCCEQKTCKKKMRYIQPPIPKSFAPVRIYKHPEQPLEDATIYRKSYIPVEAERPGLIIPPNSIGLSKDPFQKTTVHKMSYPGWRNILPPQSIVPCNHDLMGKGPIQDITTQKHDYVEKKVPRVQPILPCNNIFPSQQPLTDKTTNRLSYQPNCNFRKVEPIIPENAIKLPDGPMERNTVQKMSYLPTVIKPKEFLPWAQKKPYERSAQKMSGDTIYKKSYLPNECFKRVEAIRPKPRENFIGDGNKFESNTIYHMSYPGAMGDRPDKIVPPNSITLSNKKMDSNTINKLSYQPNPGFIPPPPIKPCAHDLLGKGPMADTTTQRHDYVEKPYTRVDPIRPTPQIVSSTQPLSSFTINRLSYQPAYAKAPDKIVPPNNLGPGTGKMDDKTVHKMSYLPVGRVEKMETPWANKSKYKPPSTRFAGNTIYKMSYDAPGEFVEDGGDDCGCHCATENECCPCPCPPTAAVC